VNHAKRKVKFIDCALGHKEQMLGQLQRMIREHRLIVPQTLPNVTDVIMELKKYRRKMIKGDDLVDALALSIYEPSVPLESESYGRVYFPDNKE
jgi:predicted RNase H-like nuclease